MSKALASYRSLLRASQLAFKNDTRLLGESRQQIRHQFDEGRQASLKPEEIDERVQYANEVAAVLRSNVIQGKKDEQAERDRYVLNIHKDTELGDNETIMKNSSNKRNTLTGQQGEAPKKCS